MYKENNICMTNEYYRYMVREHTQNNVIAE